MTKATNFKNFYRKGNCGGFTHWHSSWKQEGYERIEERTDTIYKAKFSYENFCSQIEVNAQKDADYANWLDYINKTEEAKKQINQSNQDGEEKARARKGLDEKEVNLDNGEYNQLFKKIKAIETNIQKTVPEKVKDMKEIMKQIEEKNKEITANMDDKLDQLQEEYNNLAQDFKKKMDDGNKAAANFIAVKMKEIEGKMSEIAEDKEKFTGNQWVKDWLEGLEKEKSMWFWQKLDWKNPTTYGKLSLAVGLLIGVILFIIWIVRKIASFFKNK